jgi:hypothetical protein
MATGSYEGSLATEGIPGSHEPTSFTGRWSRRPRRLSHRFGPRDNLPPQPRNEDRAKRTRARVKTREYEREEGEATGMSEARSNRHRGKTTPTLANPSGNGKDARRFKIVSELDPPKRSEWCETLGSPDKPRRAQTL